jgi:hypothetical protein
MIKLWCKIVLKTIVEYTKGNEGIISIYAPLGKLLRMLLCVHRINKPLDNFPN